MAGSIKTKIISAVAVFLTIVSVFPFIYGQSRLLSLKTSEKNIVSFEIVEYEGVPFNSAIMSRTAYSDQTMIDKMCMLLANASVSYIPGKPSSRMVFISYSDGTVLNGYINDKRTGLNYGAVWLNFSMESVTEGE